MTIDKWQRYTDIPLFILSALFLFAYSWQILKGTYLTECFFVINVVWVIYGIDYIVNLCLAKDKWKWFKQNILLLLTLILPIFRPLRMLRFVAMLQIFNRSTASTTRGRISLYATCAISLLIYVGALAEYSVEHTAPGATITSFPLALWWAFVTVTTVGYGDVAPVTGEGRCVAVVLMMTGIALIGIVSAMISSWIIDQVDARNMKRIQAEDHDDNDNKQTQMNNSAEVRLMRAEILRLSDAVGKLNAELQRTQRLAKKHDHTHASSVREHLIETLDPALAQASAHLDDIATSGTTTSTNTDAQSPATEQNSDQQTSPNTQS